MRFVLFLFAILFTVQSCYAFEHSEKGPADLRSNIEFAEEQNTRYTFEDNVMSGKVVKIEKGTELPITLQTPIDTSVTQENDEVAATLNKDLMVDGAVVAKKNSVLYGKVIKAKSASNCMRGGKVKIKFDKLVTTDNQIYSISTKAIDFVVSSDDKMATIGQTAIQVVIMALYGIATFGVGAVVIAACFFATPNGLLPVLTKKGTDAVIPAATPIEVSLDSSLNAVATY